MWCLYPPSRNARLLEPCCSMPTADCSMVQQCLRLWPFSSREPHSWEAGSVTTCSLLSGPHLRLSLFRPAGTLWPGATTPTTSPSRGDANTSQPLALEGLLSSACIPSALYLAVLRGSWGVLCLQVLVHSDGLSCYFRICSKEETKSMVTPDVVMLSDKHE